MGMSAPRQSAKPNDSSNRANRTSTPVPGVIETIADGLSLALSFPLVLLLPVLIDAAFWSGVSVSPSPLLARWPDLRDIADTLGWEADLLPVVALGLPSLLSSVNRNDVFASWSPIVLTLGSWQLTVGSVLGAALASTALTIVFRLPLALIVRNDRQSPRQFAAAIGVAWLRLVGVFALIVGAILLIVSPMLVVSAFFLVAGFNIAPLLVAVVSIPAIAAAIYLTFTADAIVLSNVGPLRAIYLSFNVVRRNFWATLGFLGSVILISEGLGVLWRAYIGTPIGLLIGVLGNAFIGAGLGLAAMRFYSTRLDRWLAPALPDAARPTTS